MGCWKRRAAWAGFRHAVPGADINLGDEGRPGRADPLGGAGYIHRPWFGRLRRGRSVRKRGIREGGRVGRTRVAERQAEGGGEVCGALEH